MTGRWNCWRCRGALPGLRPHFDRRAECPSCGAELHVCRFCVHYDPGAAQGCREERAEPPRLKDRANFCDWLQPGLTTSNVGDAAAGIQSKAALDELFCSGDADSETPRKAGSPDSAPANPLDDLFDLPGKRDPQ